MLCVVYTLVLSQFSPRTPKCFCRAGEQLTRMFIATELNIVGLTGQAFYRPMQSNSQTAVIRRTEVYAHCPKRCIGGVILDIDLHLQDKKN